MIFSEDVLFVEQTSINLFYLLKQFLSKSNSVQERPFVRNSARLTNEYVIVHA